MSRTGDQKITLSNGIPETRIRCISESREKSSSNITSKDIHYTNGSLIVVGSGIKSVAHISLEAQAWIQQSDIVLYCVADPITEVWIKNNNKYTFDLYQLYKEESDRNETYSLMTECILSHVRDNKDVCVVYYGHPGVFVKPSHKAIKIAKSEGYKAAMLPAISAEDCIFADIGFDPANNGCQTFEATDLLLRMRHINIDSHVILWQVGCLGDFSFKRTSYNTPHIPILIEYLEKFYNSEHTVFHYQGALYPTYTSNIEVLTIKDIDKIKVNGTSTLYIPPQEKKGIDVEMARKFGLKLKDDNRA